MPALEPETPGVKPDFSNTIKMPELKIPDSMKKIDIPQAPSISAPDITPEEIAEEKKNFSILTLIWRILFWQLLLRRESRFRKNRRQMRLPR